MIPFHIPVFQQKILPTLEIRERYENRHNRDFNSNGPDHRIDLFSRWRVGVVAQTEPNVKLELQYQYSHDLIRTPAKNFSTENSDISLAYGEWKLKDSMLDAGRQKISIGDQRLIGPAEWLNVPRSFDALRFRSHGLDLWASKIAVGGATPFDARVAGVSYAGPIGLTSLIYKHDRLKSGNEDIFTIDDLYTKSLNGWDLNLEGAVQTGRNSGRDQQAWAIHGRVTHALTSAAKAYVEANAASGGHSGNTVRTFDNLYPTNHDKYGIMDMQGWSNMQEFVVGVDYVPCGNALIKGSWHSFMLQDAKDAWYGASGAPNKFGQNVFVDPTGTSGRNLGQEFDIEGSTVWRGITFQAGLGFFKPGGFVRNVSGKSDTQTWIFFSAQKKF